MQVRASGWGRDHGPRVLLQETNLSKADIVTEFEAWPADRVIIDLKRDQRGEAKSVVIGCKASYLNLSGDYLLEVQLTRNDLLHLLLATFTGEKLARKLAGER